MISDEQNIFRANCIELSSEVLDSKYEEYPILYVDNLLKGKEKEEYEKYVIFGRGGLPIWKDYYAIKNLSETLEEIGDLGNPGGFKLLESIRESFLKVLLERLKLVGDGEGVDIQKMLRSLDGRDIFLILQKLEYFYSGKKGLLRLLLSIELKRVKKEHLEEAFKEYEEVLMEDSYFLDEESLFLDLVILYFKRGGGKYEGGGGDRVRGFVEGVELID